MLYLVFSWFFYAQRDFIYFLWLHEFKINYYSTSLIHYCNRRRILWNCLTNSVFQLHLISSNVYNNNYIITSYTMCSTDSCIFCGCRCSWNTAAHIASSRTKQFNDVAEEDLDALRQGTKWDCTRLPLVVGWCWRHMTSLSSSSFKSHVIQCHVCTVVLVYVPVRCYSSFCD